MIFQRPSQNKSPPQKQQPLKPNLQQEQQHTNNGSPFQNTNNNDNASARLPDQDINGNVSSHPVKTTDPDTEKELPVDQNQTYQHLKSIRRHQQEAGIYATLAETF